MFKIQWDKKNNSILFKEKLKPYSQLIPPRPVYFEEMDLLGFDKLYDYPKSEEPLLWSIGRAYYYKGEKIAEANGGGLYEKPTMNFIYTGSILPIDISKLVSANEEYLTILTNEAKTYINEIYKTYRKSHSFSVAFSGGKDSQVVLDLVSQVIPPEDYFAIFTDTEMELPETYETVSKSFKSYKQLFSNFRNIIANQFRPILDNWRDFGPPSRLQRWCCTVCKSLPHKNALDNLNLPQTDLITIEGVRKAESNRRSNYERLAIGIKHSNITNVRPIFDWNDSEVYVYLMYRSISINVAYRYGLSRVGCVVCPFSSDWSEFILSAIHPEVIEKFYILIRNSIKRIGVESDRDQIDYLRQGKWKMRAGSGALPTSDVFFSSSIESNVLQINVINPQSSILEWIKILNPFELIESIDEKTYKIKFEDKIKEFTIYIFDNGFTIHHHISKVNDMLISYLKRISYKAAYCSNCGVCYVTCPNRAISMNNVLLINRSKCSSCFKCLQVCDKGCFIAKSRTQFKGVNKMSDKKISLDKYAGFGLREEWLLNFFQNPNYWKEGLGSKQIPAFKNWLIEAELISHVKETSRLYDLLKDVELSLKWQAIWLNLNFNSNIVNWYSTIEFSYWNRINIQERLFSDHPDLAERTLKNALNALFNLFDNSIDLQETYKLGILNKKGKAIFSIHKLGSNDIHPAILIYGLYKFAEKHGFYDTTLTELYQSDLQLTPYRIFGIDRDHVKQILVSLQDNKYRIIKVEFSANLDNIFLNKELSAIDVLEILLTGELK